MKNTKATTFILLIVLFFIIGFSAINNYFVSSYGFANSSAQSKNFSEETFSSKNFTKSYLKEFAETCAYRFKYILDNSLLQFSLVLIAFFLFLIYNSSSYPQHKTSKKTKSRTKS